METGKNKKYPPAGSRKKLLVMVLSLVLLMAVATGVTLAYFASTSAPVINTFQAGSVGAEIKETVNGNTKESIAVENTGDSPVYVRVRLVNYWKDGENIAPKDSTLSVSENTAKWEKIGEYYYYTEPLAGGATTANLLSAGLTMTTDDNGYVQVIEVLADTVQASPPEAVQEVWGISASDFIG